MGGRARGVANQWASEHTLDGVDVLVRVGGWVVGYHATHLAAGAPTPTAVPLLRRRHMAAHVPANGMRKVHCCGGTQVPAAACDGKRRERAAAATAAATTEDNATVRPMVADAARPADGKHVVF